MAFSLVAYGIGGGAAAVALAPTAAAYFGFTSLGIVPGSLAATMMSAAAVANGGGIASSSLVAGMQSVGAVGLATSTAAGIIVNVAAAGVGALVGVAACSSGALPGVAAWSSLLTIL